MHGQQNIKKKIVCNVHYCRIGKANDYGWSVSNDLAGECLEVFNAFFRNSPTKQPLDHYQDNW